MNNLNKNHLLFRICLALLILCCHGCLFGGEEKKKGVVYPVATTTVPPKGPKEEAVKGPVKEPVKRDPTHRAFRLETDKRLSKLSRETKEAQQDLLTRITALEEDYQQLKDKLSLVEFLHEDSSGEITKMRERLEFELETLREQIEDYNALLVEILNRISSAPGDTIQP
ncbi:MAG: hypothetical protein ACE5IC_06590 [Candidatus Brocadiales bacterium]